VLNKPVLVPKSEVTSLGSAIFAFLAAGVFPSISAAQDALCPAYDVVEPDPAQAATSQRLFALYRALYFGFGRQGSDALSLGHVLPEFRRIASEVRGA